MAEFCLVELSKWSLLEMTELSEDKYTKWWKCLKTYTPNEQKVYAPNDRNIEWPKILGHSIFYFVLLN